MAFTSVVAVGVLGGGWWELLLVVFLGFCVGFFGFMVYCWSMLGVRFIFIVCSLVLVFWS